MAFQTEVDFTLPKGYFDGEVLQRDGTMRLATAADEILPLKDPRVQQNPAYLTIIVLARVITKLGSLTNLNTKVIEGLYATDLNFLQQLYERLNSDEPGTAKESIVSDEPDSAEFTREFGIGGGRMRGYPLVQLYQEMAFIAYHFHWPNEELMTLEHHERRRWCREISTINRQFDDHRNNPFDIA